MFNVMIVGMDNQAATVPDSSDMSISSEDDGFQQRKEGNVELQQEMVKLM
jgi:hypothetical protein